MSSGQLVIFLHRHLDPLRIGLILLSIILAAFPLYSLFEAGPFNWQIHQAAFRNGGIEALVFGGAVVLVCLYARNARQRMIALCILGLLYLRLHYVDLPLFAAILYLEALLAIGKFLVWRWRAPTTHEHGFMLHLMCGIGAYSILVAALSAVHLAYPVVLYGVVLAAGTAAAVLMKHVPYSYRIMRHGVDAPRAERLIFALLYTTVLVLAAKTNLISDFDSQWYGLRSAYVLEQGGSIFTDLGLAHFVYYYPKLYETLILPLCMSSDCSYPAAFSTVCFVFALYVVRQIVMDFTSDRILAGFAALVVGWVPVVVFSALVIKPDFFTAVVLLVAASYLMRFVAGAGWGEALGGLAALAMALCGKLAAIPFGGLMAIFCLPAAFLYVRAIASRGIRKGVGADGTGRFVLAFLLGLATFLVFAYRTYVITGLPYIAPDFLVQLAQALGFQAHFPYGDLANAKIGDSWHFNLDSLGTIYDALLFPSRLPHIVYSWTGNIFLLTGGAAILTSVAWRRDPRFVRPFLLIGVPSFVMMLVFLAFLGRVQGGDGNYYLLPIMLFTTVSVATLHYAGPRLRAGMLAALLVATAGNCIAWFGSTPTWRGGTAPFSADLTRSAWDSLAATRRGIEVDGMTRIAAVMAQAAVAGHCTALADGDEMQLFKLPCAVEPTRTLEVIGSEYFADAAALSRYVARAKFDFIVMPNVPPHTLMSSLFANYAKLPGVVTIDDELYTALDLRGATAPLPVLPAIAPEPNVPPNALLLTGYFSALDATFPDEKRPRWRSPFARADERLKKYLDVDALAMATDTTVAFASNAVPFRCPGHMDFWLGLLPIDQLSRAAEAVLTVSWSDDGNADVLGSIDIPVPQRGFQSQSVALGKCGKRITRITLHLHNAPGAQPVSAVIANPLLDK